MRYDVFFRYVCALPRFRIAIASEIGKAHEAQRVVHVEILRIVAEMSRTLPWDWR